MLWGNWDEKSAVFAASGFHELIQLSVDAKLPQYLLGVMRFEPSDWCNKHQVPEDVVSHHWDGFFCIDDTRQTLTDRVIELSSLNRPG